MLSSRRGLAVLAVAGGLLVAGQAAIPSAGASVTLGQLGVSPTPGCSNADIAQLSVVTGASYQVPENGTITSWSHNAAGGSGMLTMKVYRKVGDPNFYKVIGLDGPHNLATGLLNTFTVNIPVQPGDILGLTGNAGTPLCMFSATPSDVYLGHSAPLQNTGDAANFSQITGLRLNLTAVFVPTNTFTVGATTLNKKKGTATLSPTFPNPGTLAVSGDGVGAAAGSVLTGPVATGAAKVSIKATGKKKKQLNDKGKVKLNVKLAYTPTNGDPLTQSVQVKLKKK